MQRRKRGPDGRQRYTLADRLEYLVWCLCRILPTRLVSMLGRCVGHAHCAIYMVSRREWIDEIRQAFTHITGDTRRSSLNGRALRYFGNLGQVMFETAVLERIADNGQIEIEGKSHAVDIDQPTIFVAAHLANWELIPVAAIHLGIPLNFLYWPPSNPTRRRIMERVRARNAARVANFKLVPSTSHAARRLSVAASNGENLLIFVDEKKGGRIWGPALGRTLPVKGNRMLAARLAVKYGARVVPVFVRRLATARYECVIEPALEMPASGDAAADARHLADAIDARVEDWVRAYPEQWYWIGELTRPRGHIAGDPE